MAPVAPRPATAAIGEGVSEPAADAAGRREALDEARALIAGWLDVPPDAVDVEVT